MKGEEAMFDESDLNVFETEDEKELFREILQTYYSKNYRSSVVLLYSFLVFNLYGKLKTLANDNNTEGKAKLKEVNLKLQDQNEHYSNIEKNIIEFYKTTYAEYFSNFVDDVDYLIDLRNKCAHLRVNDQKLYIPKEYQVKMVINSMYDNIFSKKAPFASDLFAYVEGEIEKLSQYNVISLKFNRELINSIKTEYLLRMTKDSLLRSFKTFLRLCYVSSSEDPIKYHSGIFIFFYALTEHIIESGNSNIFYNESILDLIKRCTLNENYLTDYSYCLSDFPLLREHFKTHNPEIFNWVIGKKVLNYSFEREFDHFFPGENAYKFFLENGEKFSDYDFPSIYKKCSEYTDFDLKEFTVKSVGFISHDWGYETADSYMRFFIQCFDLLDNETVESVMKSYHLNSQCVNRNKHALDMSKLKEMNASRTDPLDESLLK